MGKVVNLFKGDKQMNQREITVFDIANTFLSFESMPHKKLQKLCYYAYAWHLTVFEGERLFNSYFEAWVHGPVCPPLYHSFKEYGYVYIPKNDKIPNIDKEKVDFVETVYGLYGHMTADELEALTHNEDPWRKARGNYRPSERCTNDIKDEWMIEFYKEELEES